MNAGRELDALVAEKVMGRDMTRPEGFKYPMEMPRYSTEMAAGWRVVEKLGADGWNWKIEYPMWGGRGKVHIEITRSDPAKGAFYHHESEDASLPLAICQVAKKALGVTLE